MSQDADAKLLRAFGSAVRVLRKEQGLSQEEFAHRANLDRSYLGAIERGNRSPTLRAINRLAVASGVGLAGLMAQVEREVAALVSKEAAEPRA